MKTKAKTLTKNSPGKLDEKLNEFLEKFDVKEVRTSVSHVSNGCTVISFYTATVFYEVRE